MVHNLEKMLSGISESHHGGWCEWKEKMETSSEKHKKIKKFGKTKEKVKKERKKGNIAALLERFCTT